MISPDQTGFIKRRYLFFNIGHLFNILYNLPPSTGVNCEVTLSLDPEKAFDRVEWDYVKSI